MFDKIFLNSVLIILLFCIGAWLFNHFPYPIIGIIVCVAYPIYLVRKFVMKGFEK